MESAVRDARPANTYARHPISMAAWNPHLSATNTVVTRSGPKLGLIVSAGCEKDLYGAAQSGRVFDFVPATMVAAISEPPAC